MKLCSPELQMSKKSLVQQVLQKNYSRSPVSKCQINWLRDDTLLTFPMEASTKESKYDVKSSAITVTIR